MIGDARLLAVVPARGGSKGVPRKNLRMVGGRPLIAWTIEAARGAPSIDRLIVSTDDEEIASTARAHDAEVPFLRATSLASDRAPTIDVVLDALDRCPGYEWVLLLQPTSPLRTVADIEAAVALCAQSRAPACVSVCLAQESPYWMYGRTDDGRLAPLFPLVRATRRQDLPPAYSLNGAIYLARCDWLRSHRSFLDADTVAYEMPAERSMDIDTESDLQHLQTILGK